MAQILITGGSSGIGLEMARQTLRRGHEIAITGRDTGKAEAAADVLREDIAGAHINVIALDLADFDAIDAAAPEIRKVLPELSIVLLNAGAFTRQLRLLDNGLEAMIGSMHFGHFRLMQHLLPRLEKAEAARVVVTSSVMHWLGRIREDSFFDPSRHLHAAQAYGQAKLANLLYARALARRYADTGLRINAFHPGAVATSIWRELPGAARRVVDRVMTTPEKGADTGSWLALDEVGGQHNGDYFVRRGIARSSPASRNAALGEWLWERSEAIAGIPQAKPNSRKKRA